MISLALAASFLVACCGLPFWSPAKKSVAEPYPCMHHRCGCQNAAACWKKCCCMSNAQKMAWAQRHGVTPPMSLVASNQVASTTAAPARSNCCSKKHCPPARPSVRQTGPTFDFLVLDDMRQCQGLGALWMVLSHALPAAPPAQLAAPLAPGAWLRIASETAESGGILPDAPVPWA